MPDPDVEESQIVAAEFDFPPSSPLGDDDKNDHQLPDTQVATKQTQQAYNDDAGIDSDNLEQGQDSYASRVDDTQYASIELDTQALTDSLGSKVPDTQFDNVELDTQALETQPSPKAAFSPGTDKILQLADMARPNPPPILNPTLSSVAVTFKRPEINDLDPTAGFRYSKAPDPVAGNYTHIRPKNVDRTPVPNTPQESAPVHPVSALPISKRQEPVLQPLSAPAQQDLHIQSLRRDEAVRNLDDPASHPEQPAKRSQNPPLQEESSRSALHQLHTPGVSTVSHVPNPIQPSKECTPQHPLQRDPLLKPVGLHMINQTIPAAPVSRTPFRPTQKKRTRIKAPFPDLQRTPSNPRPQRNASNPTIDAIELSNVPEPRISSIPFPETLPEISHARPPVVPMKHANHTTGRASLFGQRAQGSARNEQNAMDSLHLPEDNETVTRNALPHATPDARTKNQSRYANPVERSHANSPHQPGQEPPKNPLQAENVRHSNVATNNVPFQPPPRGSSQTPTGLRPQSSRSNIGTPIRRPVNQCQLEPRGIPENTSLGPKHTAKVHKSNEIQRCETPRTNPAPAVVPQQVECTSLPDVSTPVAVSGKKQPSTPSSFGVVIAKMHEYEDMLRDHKSRMELVESQQQEIKKLNIFGEETKKKIEALEAEKKDLSQKLKKYGTFHAQYKDHMNRVVNSQKLLLDEAKEMQKISAQAIKAYSTHKQQSVVDQMGVKIQEIKKMRLNADQLVQTERNLLARVASAEGTAQKFREDALAKQEAEVKLNDSLRTNDLLKKDLEKNLIELSRAQHNSDQLHKQLAGQLDAHKELIELLKEVPSEVFKQFTKDEGALARLLTSAATTQTKLDQAMGLVKELKTHEAQTPSSLVKLIEDMCSRIESKLQISDNNGTTVQESLNKLLEDFKERVVQLNADTETQNSLRDRISELRECNASLAAEKTAHELELQNLSNQLQASQRDLGNCRGQLASKSEELIALQKLPREDPRLLAKVRELENTNSNLMGQLNTSNEDAIKTKEELKSAQEIASSTTKNVRALENELSNAQTRIKAFDEEKKKYEAAREQLVEKEAQKIAKLSESSSKTMQMKFDSKVNNLRQKLSEVEAELKSVKEQLQRAQNENVSSEQLRTENACWKKQSLLQSTLLKRLEEKCSGWEEQDQRVNRELGSTAREIQELRSHLEATRTASCKDLEGVFEGQAEIERSIQTLNSLQQDEARYQKQKNELQKKGKVAEQFSLQKEAIEKANCEKDEEIASLRKQLDLATNLKAKAFMKEKDGPTWNEPMHRDVTQQIQLPQSHTQIIAQLSVPHPNVDMASQEDDMLMRGDIGNPKQMLRAAMKRDINVREHSATTPELFSELQTISQPKTFNSSSRRVSTRKSNNPYQSQHLETALTTTQPASKPSTSRASSRQTSMRGDSGLNPTGQNEDGEMLFSLNETSDSRFRAPPNRNSAIDHTSAASVASSAIKPFSSFPPIGESPLTDFEPVVDQMDLVHTQEQPDEAYKKPRKDKVSVPTKRVRDEHVDTGRSEKVIPDSQPYLDREPFKVQEFSDVDELPAGPKVKKAKTKPPTAEEESNRRRYSMPVKGVLKNPQVPPVSTPQITQGTSDANQSSYFPPSGSVSVLQNKPPGAGRNKAQARPAQPKSKSQNRMTSGISANAKAGTSSNTRQATSNRAYAKQPADGTYFSPLPTRKRSLEAGQQQPKRVSLPHGASNRVIADSQGRR